MPDVRAATSQPLLAELVTVRNRFLRSVHIERDLGQANGREYHLTATGHQALEAIADALEQPAQRAITLTGPYGVGKSAFCLYLVSLLGVDGDLQSCEALKDRDFRLYQRLVGKKRGLVPVLLTGSREPIAHALTQGLVRSMEQCGSPLMLEALRCEAGELLQHPDPSPREVANLYELAARLATENGADGLLLVADEVGKFLEYAATHPDRGDPFVLQELAEAAARSDQYPLLVVTVLHQAADAYARRLGRVHQVEWAKVQQRFRDVSFSPADLEQLSLIGHALSRKRHLVIPKDFSSTARECAKRGLVPKGGETRFVRTARSAYPLHAVALLALPGLFRRIGQNERSLFAFLSGEEPHAFGRFLRETPYDPERPHLLTLDALFDYAREALLGNGSIGATGREWAELIDAVNSAHSLPPLALRVLKCIGLLGILREPRLTASKEILQLSLTSGTVPEASVDEALRLLLERRLIIYSRHRRAFRVWEGGDVDVEAELQSARAVLPAGVCVQVAAALCPAPPVIARRHSYQTGTLRLAAIRPCRAPELLATITAPASHDLRLLLCLATTPDEASEAKERAKSIREPDVLVSIAEETETLREAAADVAAAHHVERSTPALASDRAARRELAERKAEAEAEFRAEWERLFGPGCATTWWFHEGEEIVLSRPRALSELLSQAADRTYSDTPILRNELVNRRTLSSAAAAARNALLGAMLTHGDKEQLGFTGFPPERSMYECLLRSTGLHRQDASGRWGFHEPEADPAKLRPVWKALSRALFERTLEPLPVNELFASLRARPYGLSNGVLPVLLGAFLLARPDETSLYEEGVFVPEVGPAHLERLVLRPEAFAAAGCRITGVRQAVLDRIAAALGVHAALVPVVRAVLRMLSSLSEHARRTRRLPKEALAVREALLRAKSPERLLFADLPAALGLSPFSDEHIDPEHFQTFFERLNHALRTLRDATPRMLDQARDILLAECGYPAGGAGLAELRWQAARLRDRVADPTLVAFVQRAASPGEDDAVVNSLLAQVAGRIPTTWLDADYDRFTLLAREMGQRLRPAMDAADDSTLTPAEEAQSEVIAAQLRDSLQRLLPHTPRHVLKSALQTLARLLDDDASIGASADEQRRTA